MKCSKYMVYKVSPSSLFPLFHAPCVSCCLSEPPLFGIVPACFIKPSCLFCRVWTGPASSRSTWWLTRIQGRRSHWVTWERSTWPDSTASPCPILTVTSPQGLSPPHTVHTHSSFSCLRVVAEKDGMRPRPPSEVVWPADGSQSVLETFWVCLHLCFRVQTNHSNWF